MFTTYGAPLDMVDDVCLHAGPINCFSCLGLHFSIPWYVLWSSARVLLKNLGDADSVSLQENTSPNGQLVPGTTEVMGDPNDLEVVGPSPEG